MALAVLLTAAPVGAHPNTKHPHQRHCSVVHEIWSPARWRRGQPKTETIRAYRSCPGWRKAQLRYYRHRQAELWRVRVTPFHYAGHDWAAPYPIALCESGGDYQASSAGAYGLITPGWSTGGGYEFAPYAAAATPREQDLVAHRLYERYGEGPWAPFETACAYR